MHKVRDRLAAARRMFPCISIDADNEGCQDLLEALKGYRRDWDDKKLMFKDAPLHDWCSDYADAFGYMCVVANQQGKGRSSDMTIQPPATTMHVSPDYTLSNLFADAESRAQRIQRIV
jgi:ABC-type uncharacterized transport system ATPase subunit